MPTVNTNGIRIHYTEVGQGDPLLLIMGLGADGTLWAEHVAAYKNHFRCIMMDNRGAGQSDKPAGPYTTAMMADDCAGLLDALGIEQAHVSGISMGGAIVQELAIRHPGRVRSATIVSSWPKCNAYTVRVFEMLRAMVASAQPAAFTRLLQLWIFTPAYHSACMADLLRREEDGYKNPHPMPLHAFQAQCDACINHDAVERLRQITAPTLVAGADADIFTPLHYSEALASGIPGAELYIARGGGHAHHWEQLQSFNQATIEFMLRHRIGK